MKELSMIGFKLEMTPKELMDIRKANNWEEMELWKAWDDWKEQHNVVLKPTSDTEQELKQEFGVTGDDDVTEAALDAVLLYGKQKMNDNNDAGAKLILEVAKIRKGVKTQNLNVTTNNSVIVEQTRQDVLKALKGKAKEFEAEIVKDK